MLSIIRLTTTKIFTQQSLMCAEPILSGGHILEWRLRLMA